MSLRVIAELLHVNVVLVQILVLAENMPSDIATVLIRELHPVIEHLNALVTEDLLDVPPGETEVVVWILVQIHQCPLEVPAVDTRTVYPHAVCHLVQLLLRLTHGVHSSSPSAGIGLYTSLELTTNQGRHILTEDIRYRIQEVIVLLLPPALGYELLVLLAGIKRVHPSLQGNSVLIELNATPLLQYLEGSGGFYPVHLLHFLEDPREAGASSLGPVYVTDLSPILVQIPKDMLDICFHLLHEGLVLPDYVTLSRHPGSLVDLIIGLQNELAQFHIIQT